jgi:outer membrane beta-barrel protein
MKKVKCSLIRSLLLGLTFIALLPIANAKERKGDYDFSWLDPEKKIYVVQNRKYEKVGTFTLGVGLGKAINSPFNSVWGFKVRGSYFLTEEFGVQLFYVKGSNSRTSLFEDQQRKNSEPLVRELNNLIGGMVLWSPFYAKMNFFNQVIYFDWIFGLGLGRIATDTDKKVFVEADGTTQIYPEGGNAKDSYTAFVGDVGVRFFLSEQLSVRFDFFANIYKAPGVFPEQERNFITYIVFGGIGYSI